MPITNYDLHCPFNANLHRQKYPHYLEVMILEDGTVEYAIPSHQEKAIQLSCNRLGVTREELSNMTPPEYYFDWLNWLLMQCKAVSVWTDFFVAPAINKSQYNALKKLKLHGVYEGRLPKIEEITR